eukprot:c53462_g1_i1 orf=512-1285(+)
MGENGCAYLMGSTNGMDVHLNGISTANGAFDPNSAVSNGVMSPCSNRSYLAANGSTNLPSAKGGLSYSHGVNGFIASNSTTNGNIHIVGGSNGDMIPEYSGAVAIPSCVISAVGNGTVLGTTIKGSSMTASADGTNGLATDKRSFGSGRRRSLWYEEEVNEDLRWCFSLSSILHTGVSKFQDITLLDTRPFGKVLILDGKLQSSEADEFVYHECLVHPAMIYHSSPKNVFIMGGGEGSTAREVLRHKSVKKVVMCDI